MNVKEYEFYKMEINNCFYIGSCRSLYHRIMTHKSRCLSAEKNKKSKTKLYKFILENGGFKNVEFEMLDRKVCTQYERFQIERNYINIYNNTERFLICLNEKTPGGVCERSRIKCIHCNNDFQKYYLKKHLFVCKKYGLKI
jgi:hypothetical protein